CVFDADGQELERLAKPAVGPFSRLRVKVAPKATERGCPTYRIAREASSCANSSLLCASGTPLHHAPRGPPPPQAGEDADREIGDKMTFFRDTWIIFLRAM